MSDKYDRILNFILQKKQDYKHAVHCINDVFYSYCDMTNSQFIAQLSSSDFDSEIIKISSSLLTQQNQSTHWFQQLNKSNKIACQQSIIKIQAQQKKQEWFHVEFLALFSHSKLLQNYQS